MDSPILSLELLYLVVNAIDATLLEGRRSLSACSSANRALSIICQERIFQDVEISYVALEAMLSGGGVIFRNSHKRTTGHNFLTLLAGSPHIGSYVQNLTIEILSPSMPAASAKNLAESSRKPSFSLYAIVPQLRNLKGFFCSHPHKYKWSRVEGRTRTFFTTIIPLVTKLDFSIFTEFPVTKFSGCSNLQELHVSTLDMDAKDTAQASRENVKLQLLEVDLDNWKSEQPMAPWFTIPQSPLDISELRTLKLPLPVRHAPHIDEMLVLCSSTLEELSFDADPDAKTWQAPNLGVLHNLHHLIIQTGMRPNSDLSNVATIWRTLPFHMLRPRQIQLDLLVWIICSISEFDTSISLLPWSDLINVLNDDDLSSYFASFKLGIGHFDSVQAVQVSMSLAALTRILDKNEGLKKLREKGILSYDCL